jgi:ferritin-like metal-binding protein YciE
VPDELCFASATWLAAAVRTREVTSVEVVDACLARIAEVNPSLNSVVRLADDARDRAREADAELAKGFKRHERETEQQVKNLERVFKSLEEPVKAEQCPGIEGLKAEHDEFVEEEKPSDDILDAFLTGAASRTEHYEIAAYTGLVASARAMGEKQAVQLLERNLKQEKEMLRDVEKIARRLAREGAKKEREAAKS